MAKNKKKAKKKDCASMDVAMESNVGNTPQAMDTSKGNTRNASLAISGSYLLIFTKAKIKSIPVVMEAITELTDYTGLQNQTYTFLRAVPMRRTIKKSIPIKRAKNIRKRKAQEKAISNLEKSDVKISKNTLKKQRIQSAKTLYD